MKIPNEIFKALREVEEVEYARESYPGKPAAKTPRR